MSRRGRVGRSARGVATGLMLVAVAAASGCGSLEREPAAAPPAVEGRIVEVREAGDGAVTSFVVESQGQRIELAVDPAVDYGFDLGHLHEHREKGEPVVCRVEERDGVLYALEIHDV